MYYQHVNWSMPPMARNRSLDELASSVNRRANRALIALFDSILDGCDRRRELAELSRMDQRSLSDLGLARADLERVRAWRN